MKGPRSRSVRVGAGALCRAGGLAGALALLAPSVAAAGPAFVPNAKRYAQRNAPTKGTAGAVTVTARALLSKARGTTEVEVTTGALDSVTPAPGKIERDQIRLLRGNGLAAAWIENHNRLGGGGRVVYGYGHLQRGQRLHVQATVSGIGATNEVVSTGATVLLRPDLKVDQLTLPTRTRPGAPVLVRATVRELHGDVGATATCALYVDGARVDAAAGIWVDGGDGVTCAFTHRFAGAGTKAVKVVAEGALPADDALANNEASGQIDVVAEAVAMSHYARVDQERERSRTRTWGAYGPSADPPDWSHTVEMDALRETAVVNFETKGPFGSPVTVSVAETNTSRSLGARRTPIFDLQGWELAVSRWDNFGEPCESYTGSAMTPDGSATFYLSEQRCWGSLTTLGFYVRSGSAVTYYSTSYRKAWTPEVTVDSYTVRGGGGPLVAADSTLHAIDVAVEGATGSHVANARLALDPDAKVGFGFDEGPACWARYDDSFQVAETTCEARSGSYESFGGLEIVP